MGISSTIWGFPVPRKQIAINFALTYACQNNLVLIHMPRSALKYAGPIIETENVGLPAIRILFVVDISKQS